MCSQSHFFLISIRCCVASWIGKWFIRLLTIRLCVNWWNSKRTFAANKRAAFCGEQRWNKTKSTEQKPMEKKHEEGHKGFCRNERYRIKAYRLRAHSLKCTEKPNTRKWKPLQLVGENRTRPTRIIWKEQKPWRGETIKKYNLFPHDFDMVCTQSGWRLRCTYTSIRCCTYRENAWARQIPSILWLNIFACHCKIFWHESVKLMLFTVQCSHLTVVLCVRFACYLEGCLTLCIFSAASNWNSQWTTSHSMQPLHAFTLSFEWKLHSHTMEHALANRSIGFLPRTYFVW